MSLQRESKLPRKMKQHGSTAKTGAEAQGMKRVGRMGIFVTPYAQKPSECGRWL